VLQFESAVTNLSEYRPISTVGSGSSSNKLSLRIAVVRNPFKALREKSLGAFFIKKLFIVNK